MKIVLMIIPKKAVLEANGPFWVRKWRILSLDLL